MEKLVFMIQGSSDEPYIVTFEMPEQGNLNAYCTCGAGRNGQHCKHRLNLLNGSPDGIVSENENDLQILADMLKGSDIEAAYKHVIALENEAAALKKSINRAKKDLAAAMMR